MDLPTISVIIVALNEGAHLRRTVAQFRETLSAGDEIVVVDDGSEDGSADFLEKGGDARRLRAHHAGVAKGRNLGAGACRGEILVFADAHLRVPPGWRKPIVEVLRKRSAGGVAPAIVDMNDARVKGYGLRLRGPDLGIEWMGKRGNGPHTAPLIPWCCGAMRREVFEATGGFDEGMVRWGSIDNEMSLRLWLLGYELWLAPRVEVGHLFRQTRPYAAEWSWVAHNKLRLALIHFERERVCRVVQALRNERAFAQGMALMVDGDVLGRRAELATRRAHDDAWYFRKFGPRW